MQIEIKFYNIITREYVEATDTSNANDIKNLKKLNPNKLYKNKNSPISIHFTRIKANNVATKCTKKSSTKRARLKWIRESKHARGSRSPCRPHTLSARRPLLDIVINILKPEASSWATMTQLVRGPDCRAPPHRDYFSLPSFCPGSPLAVEKARRPIGR